MVEAGTGQQKAPETPGGVEAPLAARRADAPGDPGGLRAPVGPIPLSRDELHCWIHQHLGLPAELEAALGTAINSVLTTRQHLWEQSKNEAMQAIAAGLAGKMARLRAELSAKDATVSSISHYFERLVTDLTEKSHHDPKTRLITFARFTEQLESFLAFEHRARWCAVGLADVREFKWYNDALGHATGDRIIARVARLLRERARADDLIAKDGASPASHELHARFGGDEFCFMIPRLRSDTQACAIGERFCRAVAEHDWTAEDRRLAEHPVRVDVGLVCILLGRVAGRRAVAGRLAAALVDRADALMYHAKHEAASHPRCERVAIRRGELVRLKSTRPPTGQIR